MYIYPLKRLNLTRSHYVWIKLSKKPFRPTPRFPYVSGYSWLVNPAYNGLATHRSPRVWFLTSALSPLAVRLIRLLLGHGDYVAAGLPPSELADKIGAEFRELLEECESNRKDREGWKERIRGIQCDGRQAKHLMKFNSTNKMDRVISSAQASLAEAVDAFERIDILLCNTSEGTLVQSICRLNLTRVSCGGHRWRTLNLPSNHRLSPSSIRSYLLRPCELHQGHSSSTSGQTKWSHNPTEWNLRSHWYTWHVNVLCRDLGIRRLLR